MIRDGLAALALIALSTATGCGTRGLVTALRLADTQLHTAETIARSHARWAAIDRAFGAAGARIERAVPASESTDFRQAAFLDALEREDIATAALVSHFWTPLPEHGDVYEVWLTALPLLGRGAEAESLAWELAAHDPDHRARWMRAWYGAIAADPRRFPPPLSELMGGRNVDELDAFGGSSSIIMRFNLAGETVGVFKPHQNVRHQSYRGEIAAYRLCHLIRCSFDVPVSQEAFVEEAEFRSLAGVDARDPLHLRTERRTPTFFEDGEGRRVLYGVVKAWVPDFTRFPIEYRDVWLPLVANGASIERLERTSARRALEEFATRERGFYNGIYARSDGMSSADLARQLSELHVFDLLINNFDRYQPQWFGMNAHWQQGGFVSIDNGASFSLPEEFGFHAARRRCERVAVFPRSMIDAIRWMDDDAAFELLFPPNPYFDDERARFEYFVERREWLLGYVDELVERYGEDAVFLWD